MLPIVEIEHTGASSLCEGMACEQQISYWFFFIWMHLCEWVCLIASYWWHKNRIDTFKIARFYTLQIICQPNVPCFFVASSIPILCRNFLSNTTNFPKVTGTQVEWNCWLYALNKMADLEPWCHADFEYGIGYLMISLWLEYEPFSCYSASKPVACVLKHIVRLF